MRALMLFIAILPVSYAEQRVPVATSPKASAVEALAARELLRYLARIYPGSSFPIATALPVTGAAVLVGTRESQPELRRLVPAEKLQGPTRPVRGPVFLGSAVLAPAGGRTGLQ